VAGNLGGENFPDKVRGGLNEGGFWAERVGASYYFSTYANPAHLELSGAILPGYPDSKWASSSPYKGITKAGVQAYRTSFKLNVPATTDAPLALKFTQTPGSNYRAIVYVNGWQVRTQITAWHLLWAHNAR
jgi:hypothetical protein